MLFFSGMGAAKIAEGDFNEGEALVTVYGAQPPGQRSAETKKEADASFNFLSYLLFTISVYISQISPTSPAATS